MKTYKCKSCGANLDVDEKKKFVTCKYCETKYSTKDLYEEDKKKAKEKNKTSKLDSVTKSMMVVPVVFVIIFVMVTIFGIIIFSTAHNAYDKTEFNLHFTNRNGTQSTFFVKDIIDEVIDSNSKNERKIEVKYQDKKTSDIEEIRDIKNNLKSYQYDVIYEYDKDGFITVIRLEEINR